MKITKLPIDSIIRDDDFNCRGRITNESVRKLAADIQQNGLDTPITVKTVGDGKYKIISGHRRWTACKLIGKTDIDCIVRDDLTEDQERSINIRENLFREDLTLLQEAQGIKYWVNKGWKSNEIGSEIGKSTTWAKQRMALLEMPDKVQEYADKGLIKSSDLLPLYKYRKDPVKMIEIAAKIANLRLAKKPNLVRLVQRPEQKATTKRSRSPAEISEMMQTIREYLMQAKPEANADAYQLISPQGNCLATMALAWAAGYVDNGDLYYALENYCEAFGIVFFRPKEGRRTDVARTEGVG